MLNRGMLKTPELSSLSLRSRGSTLALDVEADGRTGEIR